MCNKGVKLYIRARSIAVCDFDLLEAEPLRSAWAVVVACQDVVGLFTEAAPVVWCAGIILELRLKQHVSLVDFNSHGICWKHTVPRHD